MGKRYKKIFARYYDSFMVNLEERIKFRRDRLINDLTGNILEIGCGTGINFKFYSSSCNVIAVEPSLPMLEKAQLKLIQPNITIFNYGIDDKALYNLKPKEGFDVIVCTLVLCTVPNIEEALSTFKALLKNKGKLVILEHIHSKHPVKSKFQNLINPVWKKVGEGCNLNRKTDEILVKNGFTMQKETYFKHGLDFYEGVFTVNN